MSEHKDGGPAFPKRGTARANMSGYPDWSIEFVGGMSLRDYFAAKALNGLIASEANQTLAALRHKAAMLRGVPYTELLTAEAYQLADAMLAAAHEGARTP